MPAISPCPRCQGQVTIPANVLPTARVRCPLCRAEYPLSETMPPELVVVGNAREESTWAEDLVAEPPVERAEQEEELVDEAAAVAGQIPFGVAPVRRRRAPKAWWQTMLEVVTGGLAGCLVAYYGLAFWLGPDLKNKGFPILSYLPGITWLTTPPEKVDALDKKPAEEKTNGGKGGLKGESHPGTGTKRLFAFPLVGQPPSAVHGLSAHPRAAVPHFG